MRSLKVQMGDFNSFFLKDNMEGCFACSASNSQANKNFSELFSRDRTKFFDIERIFKEIEQKEMRQQTLSTLREGFSSHKKNHSQVNFSSLRNELQFEKNNQILILKEQQSLSRQGSGVFQNKENHFTQGSLHSKHIRRESDSKKLISQ